MKTITLCRPVGPKELALIEQSGWKTFPPRLPDQPIFYPVMNEDYATKIARDWNVPASGSGFVTRFEVDAAYLQRFQEQVVGSNLHRELWVSAEELPEFNQHIVGLISVTKSFGEESAGNPDPNGITNISRRLREATPPEFHAQSSIPAGMPET